MRLTVKGWERFQHYGRRMPPWIKLHRSLLDDYDFACLHVASKALAPLLWLLASEAEDGVILGPPDRIAFRLRMTVPEFLAALKPLCDKGFMTDADADSAPPPSDAAVMFDHASTALASCKQDACIEAEAERETETEAEAEAEAEQLPPVRVMKHTIIDREPLAPVAQLVIAANAAIDARFGCQAIPLSVVSPANQQTAQAIAEAGVPITYAVERIAEVGRRLTAKPKSLAYFRDAVIEQWQKDSGAAPTPSRFPTPGERKEQAMQQAVDDFARGAA